MHINYQSNIYICIKVFKVCQMVFPVYLSINGYEGTGANAFSNWESVMKNSDNWWKNMLHLERVNTTKSDVEWVCRNKCLMPDWKIEEKCGKG